MYLCQINIWLTCQSGEKVVYVVLIYSSKEDIMGFSHTDNRNISHLLLYFRKLFDICVPLY